MKRSQRHRENRARSLATIASFSLGLAFALTTGPALADDPAEEGGRVGEEAGRVGEEAGRVGEEAGRVGEGERVGTDEEAAERLFVEGRVLMSRGDNAGACVRFEASHKLKPSATGPLFNLALCSEELGRYATAVPLLKEVIERSRDTLPERAAIAEARLRVIEPKLSFLRVIVPNDVKIPGLSITIDGRPLEESTFDTDVPTDGGERVVEVSAPRKRTYRVVVALGMESDRKAITLPPLTDLPDTTTTGLVIGSAGLASLAVGIGLGVSVAVQCGGLFQDVCQGANELPPPDRDVKLRSLDTLAWVSNVAIGVGVLAIAAGSYLVLTSPARGQKLSGVRRTDLRIWAGGAMVDGTF